MAARQWTLTQHKRQAELINQWQPWKHSAGARTPQCKAVSSQNAFKHGMGQLVKQSRYLSKAHKALMNSI
jgi:hypothetical protein